MDYEVLSADLVTILHRVWLCTCIRVRSCADSGRNSWFDPWNIRVHADVTEVSQRYILDARNPRDSARDLLSAIEFGYAEWLA